MIRQFPTSLGAGYTGTSSSSNSLGTGTKVFTTQIGMAFVVGQRCIAVYDATHYMEGTVVSYVGTTLTLSINVVYGSGTYAGWVFSTGGVSGAGGNTFQLGPGTFAFDDTNIGADFGSAFSGLVASVDFDPDNPGTMWSNFNFRNSGFSEAADLVLDLHWVANGTIVSNLVTRVTVNIWVLDLAGTPVLLSPTATITTDIPIVVAETGTKRSSLAFITLPNASISTSCDTILISITREADHANDTYTGVFQLINMFARQ